MRKALLTMGLALVVLAGGASAARAAGTTSLVEVDVPDAGAAARLDALGVDVARDTGPTVEVMLHSAQDARALAATGYPSRVLVADLGARNRRAREAEARAAARLRTDPETASELPSGRVSYRTLDEINAELEALAEAHPDRVKLFALPHRSLLGRTVWGVEISEDVHEETGKPVFLNTGVHHAREWPTAEFVLEFAREVLERDDDARFASLLERGRLVAVPVVNPDGYDVSRRLVQEQKRKNCRVAAGQIPTAQQCADPANFSLGVDPNRNYGAFWGGPGSSASPTASNHRGEAPFSEPEIRNLRELSAAHQVTVAINNHTPDERLLRAPSSSNEPVPADVEVYDALAQLLGADLGWPAGPWTEIYYEASGTAEQTAYYSAGTLAFTPEATPGFEGADRFHPPYEYVVDQYLGTDFYAGSSMRRAYLTAWEASVDPSRHAVITGRAPRGTRLAIAKAFSLDTSAVDGTGPVASFGFALRSTLTVPRGRRFEWHVNPSLRPSQYASAHLAEEWAITCAARDGRVARTVRVTLARGGRAEVDLRRCPRS